MGASWVTYVKLASDRLDNVCTALVNSKSRDLVKKDQDLTQENIDNIMVCKKRNIGTKLETS